MDQPHATAPTAPAAPSAVPRRFALLRYFSIGSLICTVFAAGVLGVLYRQQAVEELIAEARFDNVAFATVLSYTLSSEVAQVLRIADRTGNSAAVERIDRSVREQARPFRAAKVKIYARDGAVVYSTRAEEIGGLHADNPGVVAALLGKVTSNLVHRDQFNAFDQVMEDRDLLQTYLPVRAPVGGAVIGVFELYSDMTSLLVRIRKTERVVIGSVAATMLVLYGLLFLIVRHADRIIRRQDGALHEHLRQIARQNLELEHRVRDRTAELEAVNLNLLAQIADRQAAEQELKLTRERAWQQEKLAAIGRLAAGIVHEVGNPLAAVRGLAEAASDDLTQGQNEAVERSLALLRDQVRRLESITRDVSAFAVPDSQEPELINLNELASLVVNVLRYDVKLHDIRIDLELDPALPAAMGVPGQLWQVFMNLILNAAEAIERNAAAVRSIRLRTARDDGHAVLTVQDDGAGMDEEAVARAFEPFETTKAPGQGMGIGLSLCYSIVQDHGGTIAISSRPSVGTTVSVRLPLTAPGA